MRFFNKLLSSTEGADAKVYIQHELELAGFDAEQLEKVRSIVYPNYAHSWPIAADNGEKIFVGGTIFRTLSTLFLKIFFVLNS